MPFFETTRFQGTLSGHGSSVPIGFDAAVDDIGMLQLSLDPMSFSPEARALHIDGRPGAAADLVSLEGRSEAGHVLRSNSFFIGQFRSGSQPGQELSYQGDCYDAELELPSAERPERQAEARVWRVRQFRTFRRIVHETPLGRVFISGPRQDREAQGPSGTIAICRPEDSTSQDWWEESERFLTHVSLVLSFACDTYLLPVIEERYHEGGVTVRILRQSRVSGPFMPPFHELHLEPIFANACDSYFSGADSVVDLDPAIRWLTAPVTYDESRLINAMSALENILDGCGLEAVDRFMSSSAFRRVATQVRALLRDMQVSEGMTNKVPELNRRSLAEKVMALLAVRSIAVGDMPEGWLPTVIRQRNVIVHTGVSGAFDHQGPDILDHTIWVREIVTRLILDRLGFEGAYRSWLHHDEQLRFPECIPMQDWVARQDVEDTGMGR